MFIVELQELWPKSIFGADPSSHDAAYEEGDSFEVTDWKEMVDWVEFEVP